MNIEYWTAGIEECLEQERISATPDQIARMGKRLAEGASVATECSGISEQTKASSNPGKTPEQLRIEKLERIVDGLSARLGVSVDMHAEEIVFLTRVGTAHMGTTREAV